MVFGSGAFGRWSGHENRDLIKGVSALIGADQERSLAFVSGKLSYNRSLKFSSLLLPPFSASGTPVKEMVDIHTASYLSHTFHFFAFGSGLQDSIDFITRPLTGLLTITILLFSLPTELFLVPNIFLIARYSFLFSDCIFYCSGGLFLFMYAPSFQSRWNHLLIFFYYFVPGWSLFPKSTFFSC